MSIARTQSAVVHVVLLMERSVQGVTDLDIHFEGIKVMCVTTFPGGHWKSRRIKVLLCARRMKGSERSTIERIR